MNKRKAYVRVVWTITHLAEPIEITAGVELEHYLPVTQQYRNLRSMMETTLSPSRLSNFGDDLLAATLESSIRAWYPGKSYFIEVGRGKLDEYVQVFEP